MLAIPVTLTVAVLLVIYRPVLTLLGAAVEAWGYARINGLSMNLAYRLLYYSLVWAVGGAGAIALTWNLW
jgi:hypothetical protein